MNHQRSATFFPTLFGLFALVSWSCAGALTRTILDEVPLLPLLALGYGISGVVLLASYRVGARSWRAILGNSPWRLAVLSLLFVAMALGYFGAIEMVTDRSQMPGLLAINFFWPTLAVLCAVPILRLEGRKGLLTTGIALGTSGLLLVIAGRLTSSATPPPLPAIAAMLASNLSWGLFSALSRKFSDHLPSGAHVGLHHLSVAVAAIALILAGMGESHAMGAAAVGAVTLYALCVLAFGYWGWDYGMRKGRFGILASASYLTPVASIGSAAIILNTSVPILVWAALLLFIGASYFCRHGIPESSDAEGDPPEGATAHHPDQTKSRS